jgi:hypothetical protein
MTTQQTDTDSSRKYRHGGNWFDFGRVCLYAPPKTGSTTLHANFNDYRKPYAPPLDRPFVGSWRNPIDRWISAYNMIVIGGSKRFMKSNDMVEKYGQKWFDTWMPDPDTIRDPIGHARRFLATAQKDIEAQGWELHFCSQSHCYRRSFGDDFLDNPNLRIIDYTTWLDEIYRATGERVKRIGNVGVYDRVPLHYYNTLKPALARHFEEDLEVWRQVRINTRL